MSPALSRWVVAAARKCLRRRPAIRSKRAGTGLAGNIFKVLVKPGDRVTEGQKIMVLEAMKMETDVSTPEAGIITEVMVKEGDAVTVGQPLLSVEPANG